MQAGQVRNWIWNLMKCPFKWKLFLVPCVFVEVSAILLFLQSADVNHFSQIEGLLACFFGPKQLMPFVSSGFVVGLWKQSFLLALFFCFLFLSPHCRRRPRLWRSRPQLRAPRGSASLLSAASFTSRLIPATSWQSKVLNGSEQGHISIIQQSFNCRRSESPFPFDSTGSFRFHQSGCFLPLHGV